MNMTQLARALMLIGVAGAGAAYADEAPQKTEKIEVTGSSIKRTAKEGALPVTTISKEDIQRSGATTAQDLINLIPSNFGGTVTSNSVGYPGVASTANLRSLGAKYTLVLLNGRRVANYAFGNSVIDLNSIPLSVIERVEVLRDGASAIYGADAVAGVINFITKKNFTGLEAATYQTHVAAGGGNTQTYTATLGFGDLDTNRYNAFISAYHEDDQRLRAVDRDFAKTGFRPDIKANNFSTRNGVPNLNFTDTQGNSYTGLNPYRYNGCNAPDFALHDYGSSTACATDFVHFIDIMPKASHDNVVGRVVFNLDPSNQVYAEGMHVRDKIVSVYSPSPYTTSNATLPGSSKWYPGKPTSTFPNGITLPKGMTLPAGYIMPNGTVLSSDTVLTQDMSVMPDGTPIGGRWRTVAGGPRIDDIEQKTDRFVIGVKGNLLDWDYDAAITSAKNEGVVSFGAAQYSYAKLTPLVNSGVINLLGPQDQTALTALKGAELTGPENEGTSRSTELDFHVSKEIANFDYGPLGLALGGSYRKEKLDQHSEPVMASGDLVGGNGPVPSVTGSRNVYALFAEASLPLYKDLEGQLAARYDSYKNNFNGAAQDNSFHRVSPKFGLRYQPVKELLIRSSYAQGFRAPTLFENLRPFTEGGNTSSSFSDLLRCNRDGSPKYPDVGQLQDECLIQQTTATQGDPNLKPEKSKQFSLGFVIAPNNNFSASLDYWNIKINDAIVPQSEIQVLGDQVKYANRIVRYDPAVYPGGYDLAGGLPGLNGKVPGLYPGSTNPAFPIAYVYLPFLNTAEKTAAGWDINLSYKQRVAAFGTFGVTLDGTYFTKHGYQYTDTPAASDLGAYGDFGPAPRWRHTLVLNWHRGAWGGSLTQNYTAGYKDFVDGSAVAFDSQGRPTDSASYPLNRKVSSYTTWDVLGTWNGIKGLELALGVKNLFDQDPPSSRTTQNFQFGYDATLTDPRGRMYYLTAKYKFF
jgi:iron complex outermembrane receptor protein